MLENVLFANVPATERRQLLNDNCDSVEEKQYAKSFTPEQLTQKRVELENVSIDINDLEEEKKNFLAAHKIEMQPLKATHQNIITELKQKTTQVTEVCYAFIDEESRMVGYYNGEGHLIYSRPAVHKELQRTIQMDIRRTGTDN